jgi:tRNA1Val (adenine37-N6)-methyltransferase
MSQSSGGGANGDEERITIRGDKARPRRRPAGWVAPGPQPKGPGTDADLQPCADEDLSYLTGNYRIFQKRRGHRWSVDDFLTAYFAIRDQRPVHYALDLGCGIGSVLQMVAWGYPHAHVTGIEAQEVSYGLLCRSLRYNGLESRTTTRFGDLRTVAISLPKAAFDLITGTPPYFAESAGIKSDKPQKGPCLFETRGGLEDYCNAAARLLAPDGKFWVCAGPYPETRGPVAAQAAGLVLERWLDIVPRRGKPILFRVFCMSRQLQSGSVPLPAAREEFVVREADGNSLLPAIHPAR